VTIGLAHNGLEKRVISINAGVDDADRRRANGWCLYPIAKVRDPFSLIPIALSIHESCDALGGPKLGDFTTLSQQCLGLLTIQFGKQDDALRKSQPLVRDAKIPRLGKLSESTFNSLLSVRLA
jgi:hypothetical protein